MAWGKARHIVVIEGVPVPAPEALGNLQHIERDKGHQQEVAQQIEGYRIAREILEAEGMRPHKTEVYARQSGAGHARAGGTLHSDSPEDVSSLCCVANPHHEVTRFTNFAAILRSLSNAEKDELQVYDQTLGHMVRLADLEDGYRARGNRYPQWQLDTARIAGPEAEQQKCKLLTAYSVEVPLAPGQLALWNNNTVLHQAVDTPVKTITQEHEHSNTEPSSVTRVVAFWPCTRTHARCKQLLLEPVLVFHLQLDVVRRVFAVAGIEDFAVVGKVDLAFFGIDLKQALLGFFYHHVIPRRTLGDVMAAHKVELPRAKTARHP